MRGTLRERFEAKFLPEPNTGCWLWMAAMGSDGYGSFWNDQHSQMMGAHRVAWLLFRGPIPPGLEVDHLCRVRSCVNPDHLRVVTKRENIFAPGSVAIAAKHAAQLVCPKCGTPYQIRRGERRCPPCTRSTGRESARRYRAKQRTQELQ